MHRDLILLRGIDLPVLLGVPEEERACWQTLVADIEVELQRGFDNMSDDIRETLDYEQLTKNVRALAAARPRKLLETLASEIMAMLFGHGEVAAATVELRKRVLPGVDHVAVRMRRVR